VPGDLGVVQNGTAGCVCCVLCSMGLSGVCVCCVLCRMGLSGVCVVCCAECDSVIFIITYTLKF
jgi:hypothetical protein